METLGSLWKPVQRRLLQSARHSSMLSCEGHQLDRVWSGGLLQVLSLWGWARQLTVLLVWRTGVQPAVVNCSFFI